VATGTSEPRAAIGDFLDRQRPAQIRFLSELVKVPSDNPPGDCAAHARRAADLLEQLGFTVEQHAVPVEAALAVGMVSAINLVCRHRFSTDGPTVALNAHGDVVPPGEGWTKDPYGAEVSDGWMYGRGVAVSKSDFATYAWALLALEASGARLAGSVELHFTYDEETGGAIGPQWLLQRRISRPDFAISAGFSYGIVVAHNGCLHLEVEIRGRSAHAARPKTGHDALEAATAVLGELYAGRNALDGIVSSVPGITHPSLVVGLISGGINTNVVPDRIVFRLDRRIVPEEDADQVERQLTASIKASAARWPGIRCDVRRVLLAKPLRPVAGQDRLVDALRHNAEAILGEPVLPHGVPLYTDARHYSAAGVSVVLYGAGPRDIEAANAHRADERLLLDDLFKATKVVALTLLDLLGGDVG
jgi:succinyl-diaminopimelate desuccinylase